ncbi:ras guanine nucleotide exchange factor domain-containing protein [Dichotomocladium elegans]|nr:ras guanine nucleotide exchange factor domain-containing protein [Dichotomocladium elegans]
MRSHGELDLSNMVGDDSLHDSNAPFQRYSDDRTLAIGNGEDGGTKFSPETLPATLCKYVVPLKYRDLFPMPTKEGGPTKSNPLTWECLYSCGVITIHNLIGAIDHGLEELYHPYAMAVVNTIRYMLLASGGIEKDSLKSHPAIQSHRRSVIAALSKLILTSAGLQNPQPGGPRGSLTKVDATNRDNLLGEARETLAIVKVFVDACKFAPIQLHPIEATLCDLDPFMPTRLQAKRVSTNVPIYEGEDVIGFNSGLPTTPRLRTNRQGSAVSSDTAVFSLRSSMTGATSVVSSTNESRIESDFDDEHELEIETYRAELQEAAVTMLSIVQASKGDDQRRQQTIGAQLLGRLDHLSSRTAEMVAAAEKIHLSKEDEQTMAENKQILLRGFGILFCKLQLMTGEAVMLETLLSDIEIIIMGIKEPIESIAHCLERQTSITNDNRSIISYGSGNISFLEDFPMPQKAGDPKWYMQNSYTADELQFSSDGLVKSGTIAALVERLTLHDQTDMNFNRTFLLTYRCFCTSAHLLSLLTARFKIPTPNSLTFAELEDWTENKQKLIRLRVLNIIKLWIEHYLNPDEERQILDGIQEFLQSTPESSTKAQLERLVAKKRLDNPLRTMVSTPRNAPEPIIPRKLTNFKLLDINPLETARQLTLMDFGLYCMIRPSECLNKGWSSPDKTKSPHIRHYIEYNNQLTAWVSDSVLSQNETKKRANIIKYWVQVAERCREMNNFNTSMAILSAFDSSAIGRLYRTWEVVGSKSRASLNGLRKVFGANRNFAEYRTLIHSVNPPCIPFLGVYLQDMTFIQDGNPDTVMVGGRNLINFGKMAKIGGVIRDIEQYQNVAYPFQHVEVLQTFIKANLQSTRDDDTLYTESLKIEPKEREDEKVTRLLEESGFI